MKRNSLLLLLGIFFVCSSVLFFFTYLPGKSHLTITKREDPEVVTLFPYQCVDTMKVSRDKARLLKSYTTVDTIIANEVQTIASLGANCIAVGTPYDEEFLPYLRKWVAEARKAHLAVWFRGNQSAWEGWFEYEKNESTDEHIAATVRFIEENPDLFQDGDIFSANVEPENGGPFAPVDSPEKEAQMREYLIKEQTAVTRAFVKLDKSVITSWISLSGGVAKAVLDDATVAALHHTVTLDHYVRDTADMTAYIDDFSDRFHARVVLGEFGAPIPDLNGEMTAKQQATFVDELFQILTAKRNVLDGVNYWTFSESSTALVDERGLPKPVVEVIKKYYMPATIHLTVTDRSGKPLERIPVIVDTRVTGQVTDNTGQATLIVPQGKHKLQLRHPDGTIVMAEVNARGHDSFTASARFVPQVQLFVPVFNFLQNF